MWYNLNHDSLLYPNINIIKHEMFELGVTEPYLWYTYNGSLVILLDWNI